MKKLSRLLGTVLLLLSCSTFAMADPISIALPDPGTGGPSGPSPFDRYTFTWSGVIQGFADGSPFEMFNGQEFTLSGFYFSNGTFDFTRMDFVGLPDPDGGGGGSLVALPDPDSGGPGCLFLPPPELGGSLIALIPRFEITTLPDGTRAALFLSLDFNGIATNPTISTYSYTAAPVPEPSTILLFAAGLAGLTAIGRRGKTFVKKI